MIENDSIKYKISNKVPVFGTMASVNMKKDELTKLVESNNYDFIINLSEDGWFGQSIGPEQHFVHAIFRSIEEGKNIIRSANNGFSALIDPYGDVINKIESTQKGVIEIKNFQNTKKTLFSIIGNKMFFYFILFYISLIFLINKSEKE